MPAAGSHVEHFHRPGDPVLVDLQQLALNSLQRGAAEVTVQMWNQPDALICEVVDDTVIDDVLLGRRVPGEDEHDGLWHANQLCDLVQMRSSSAGTTVRIHAWK